MNAEAVTSLENTIDVFPAGVSSIRASGASDTMESDVRFMHVPSMIMEMMIGNA
jgi:hypothetical protein